MSIASWVEIGQFTFALIVSWLAARLWLTRQPQIAAQICIVGILLSTTLALAMLLAVPRPLTYRSDSTVVAAAISSNVQPSSNSASPSTTLDAVSFNTNSEFQAPGLKLRIVGKQMLDGLTSLSNQSQEHPFLLRAIGLGIALGISLQICLVGLGTWELLQLYRSATDIACPMTLAKLNRLCERAGILDPPRLRAHPFVNGAFVSWLDPRVIYLPSGYTAWTTAELEAALAHEMMHVARNDGWWRYVSRVCVGVLWFHPAAWLLHRQLCLAQEMNADLLASQLITGEAYLFGLAKLGLRLDSNVHCRNPKLGVSVFSKDLIRRIEMLKRNERTVSRAKRQMAQATLAVVALVGVSSLCWTVDADEDVRIASRVVEDSSQLKQGSFEKEKHRPWEVVPAAEGYAAIRFSDLHEHPYISSLLAFANKYLESGLMRSGYDEDTIKSLSEQGLHLKNVALAQLNIDVTSSFSKIEIVGGANDIDNDTQASANGNTSAPRTEVVSSFAVTSNQFVIDTAAPIQWQSVAGILPLERLTEKLNNTLGPVEKPNIQKMLDKLTSIPSDQTRFSLHTEPSCGDAVDGTLAGVWETVDGGLVTFAINYHDAIETKVEDSTEDSSSGFFSMSNTSASSHSDLELAVESDEQDSTELSKLMSLAEIEQDKLNKMIGYLGVGIDTTPSPNTLQFRLVCTPVEGTSIDELQAQWDRFASVAIQVIESEESKETFGDDLNSLEFMKQLLKMQGQRLGSDGKSTLAGLVFTGTVPLP